MTTLITTTSTRTYVDRRAWTLGRTETEKLSRKLKILRGNLNFEFPPCCYVVYTYRTHMRVITLLTVRILLLVALFLPRGVYCYVLLVPMSLRVLVMLLRCRGCCCCCYCCARTRYVFCFQIVLPPAAVREVKGKTQPRSTAQPQKEALRWVRREGSIAMQARANSK